MKRTLVISFLMGIALTSYADDWHFGSFQLHWEDGWNRADESDMVRLVAPSPVHVGVTVDVIDRKAPREESIDYAKKTLPLLASHHGKVVEELKEESLASGATLFSIACYDADHNYFGIVFVCVSLDGRLAQLAFEGVGKPSQFFHKYIENARTSRWADEPNHSPDPTPAPGVPPAGQESRHG